MFSKVWSKGTTSSNESAGLRATGIYAFDPTVIPETAFPLSTLSERQQENNFISPKESNPTTYVEKASSTDKMVSGSSSSSSVSCRAHLIPNDTIR